MEEESVKHLQTIGAGVMAFALLLAGISAAEFARMEAQLDELGDAKGVTALSDRRTVMNREIAAIEANLSKVRSALCW